MKINYDFSNFGRTILTGAGVNGITRVTEELALAIFNELDQSSDFLEFSTDYYPQAAPYIDRHFDALGISLKTAKDSSFNRFIYDYFVSKKLPFHKGRGLGKFLGYESSMREVDVFYSPFFPPLTRRREKSRAVFLTIHDIISETSPQFFTPGHVKSMSRVYRSIVEKGDYFFAVSHYTKNQFCEYFDVSEDRVFVTELGVGERIAGVASDDDEAVLNKYGLSMDQPYLLCLATLEPRKNMITLLKAFESLRGTLKNERLKLVMCGSAGWGYSSSMKLIESSNYLRNNVIITGFVPDQDIGPLYRCALSFCYIPFEEGFGLPPLEAMSCGVPVISSSTSSIPEVVGNAGLLVDPSSIEDVRENIKMVLLDDELRMYLSRAGIERAKRFTWKKTAQNMINFFSEKG